MAIPYKVTVKSDKEGIRVDIVPMAIATSESYVPIVVRTIQHIITTPRMNTLKGRGVLKDELIKALEDFHKQGVVKPQVL